MNGKYGHKLTRLWFEWWNRYSKECRALGASRNQTYEFSIKGGILYNEWRKFNSQLTHLPDVFAIEKQLSPYICVDWQGNKSILRDEESKSSLRDWLAKHNLSLADRHPLVLLRMAQSADSYIRRRALQTILKRSCHWPDSECLMVSQAIDLKTAVRLARIENSDLRLQRKPPKLPDTLKLPVDELQALVTSLPTSEISQCAQYFTDVAVKRGQRSRDYIPQTGIWNHDGSDLAEFRLTTEYPRVVDTVCLLQALIGHCQVERRCLEAIDKRLMIVLRHVYDTYHCLPTVVLAVARVIACLSVHPALHRPIFDAGWVSILADWMRSTDVNLSLTAAKSLANLDHWNAENTSVDQVLYRENVYVYHPKYYTDEQRLPIHADIIFVHGLLGGPFLTWRQQDMPIVYRSGKSSKTSAVESSTDAATPVNMEKLHQSSCWPKDWLAGDCPQTRLLSVEYETKLSRWAPQCPYELQKRTLEKRAEELLGQLEAAGIGQRPIIWVGHSMGGLLIKQMLALANEEISKRHLVDETVGVVFYSVPHNGCSLAEYSLRPALYWLYPSVEVQQLRFGSEHLKALHAKFTKIVSDGCIELLSFAEGESTDLPLNFKATIVPHESSDPGFGEFLIMPGLNHLNICKPEHRNSPLYQHTVRFIRSCITSVVVDKTSPATPD